MNHEYPHDDDVRRTAAIVRWQHSAGGPAYCLARLVVRPAPEPPVVVLTELAGNSDAVGLTSDFGGAATAALAVFGPNLQADPRSIVWLAQHGDFSSYDAAGAPETFTEVSVDFDGRWFSCELTDHRLLPVDQAAGWRQALGLDPVVAALAVLGTAS